MASRALNLKLIGGNSPVILAEIKEKNTPCNPKKYTLEMYIARHGKTLDDRPKGGYIAHFYYDRALRKLRTVIPKKQSIEMFGDYVYHFGITQQNQENFMDNTTQFRPEYGRINFIQGISKKEMEG